MLGGKAYGIVLPRGLVAEAALRWSTIFVKAINDPDFVREIGNTGMRVEYVPAR
jgi:tripartite-type tricarboxylate transporter receptor subunit TctC